MSDFGCAWSIKKGKFKAWGHEIDLFSLKGPVYIYGDFNARTGNAIDIIENDKFDEDFCLENQTTIPKRNSHDSSITKRGNELLDICTINDLLM